MNCLTRITLSLLAILLAGCSSSGQVRQLNSSGVFPAGAQVAQREVKVAKPFSAKYKQMAYLMVNEEVENPNTKFMIKLIKNSGVFQKTVDIPEMERLIVERNLQGLVSGATDLISLNKLQQQIGPFVIVEPVVDWAGGYNHTAIIKIVDPATGETVLHLEKTAFNWDGLDDPLTYPVMNAFLQWSRGEQISVSTQAAPKQ